MTIDPVTIIGIVAAIDRRISEHQRRSPTAQTTPIEAELMRKLTDAKVTATQYLLEHPQKPKDSNDPE